MRKSIFFLIMLYSVCASGKWLNISETPQAKFYIDDDTLKKIPNGWRFWELTDYKSKQIAGTIKYQSTKELMEIDCDQDRIRSIAFSAYEGPFGSNFLIGDEKQNNWSFIAPETTGTSFNMLLLKHFCRQ